MGRLEKVRYQWVCLLSHYCGELIWAGLTRRSIPKCSEVIGLYLKALQDNPWAYDHIISFMQKYANSPQIAFLAGLIKASFDTASSRKAFIMTASWYGIALYARIGLIYQQGRCCSSSWIQGTFYRWRKEPLWPLWWPYSLRPEACGVFRKECLRAIVEIWVKVIGNSKDVLPFSVTVQ